MTGIYEGFRPRINGSPWDWDTIMSTLWTNHTLRGMRDYSMQNYAMTADRIGGIRGPPPADHAEVAWLMRRRNRRQVRRSGITQLPAMRDVQRWIGLIRMLII
jgi:hypothetical protein